MFTGIIEEIGEVTDLQFDQEVTLWDGSQGQGTVLTVRCQRALEGAYLGCSIAVNGVCLTVVTMNPEAEGSAAGTFVVNLAPETLRRSNLAQLRMGDGVNLERAMLATDRNSGHMVQGHVDATGRVVRRYREGDSLWIHVQTDAHLIAHIVEKGFIAVDGTSLTVCEVDRSAHTFSFMLIPHTQSAVVIPRRQIGHEVNLEVDVVAKYVAASMQGFEARLAALELARGADSTTPNPAATAATTPAAPQTHQSVIPGMTAVTAMQTSATGDEEIQEIQRQGKTVHGEGLSVPDLPRELAQHCRIGVVYTCWHPELINALRDNTREQLVAKGVLPENIVEAGSYELPYAARCLKHKTSGLSAIICIGILIKGGTIHMEVIANAVSSQIMELQFQLKIPVIFGVLTVMSLEQAAERAHSSLGASWANSALAMVNIDQEVRLRLASAEQIRRNREVQ